MFQIYYDTKTDLELYFSHALILFSNPFQNAYSKQQTPSAANDQPTNPFKSVTVSCHCVRSSTMILCFSFTCESVCGITMFPLKTVWNHEDKCLGYVNLKKVFVVDCSVFVYLIIRGCVAEYFQMQEQKIKSINWLLVHWDWSSM